MKSKLIILTVASILINVLTCNIEKDCEASDWSTQDTILQSAVIGVIALEMSSNMK